MKVQSIKLINGIDIAVVAAEIKVPDRYDFVLLRWSPESSVAATFTRNLFCAAPVILAKKHLSKMPCAAVINTGYANAATGARGLQDATEICQHIARALDVRTEQILPFSTGVIGEFLPMERFRGATTRLVSQLGKNDWMDAAKGIMTTDTRPKAASYCFKHEGKVYQLTGIVKGSGMIRPNMATMLAFMATDISIDSQLLDKILRKGVENSFNLISVDGDTSTNDACLLVATGAAGNAPIKSLDDPLCTLFCAALDSLLGDLAQLIVRDAEGATKFVAIHVRNAKSRDEALALGFDIAHSPLVKTAFFASDPNWGRIIAVIGRASIQNLDTDRVRLYICGQLVFEHGAVASNYDEEKTARLIAKTDLDIDIDLARGTVSEKVWTCDLSYDYVRINADYRN